MSQSQSRSQPQPHLRCTPLPAWPDRTANLRKVKSESWLDRMGLGRGSVWKKGAPEPDKAALRVLAFEVASLMSKTVQLWHFLGDDQITKLRDEALRLDGVRKLVSDDDDLLLGLALAEMMDSLGFLAGSVARLGKKCSDPLLQRFDNVFADLIKNDADLYEFQFASKKMVRKVKKMEKLVATTSNLYQELEVLTELEQGLRRMLANPESSLLGNAADFKHKVVWQRQEVKYLRESSLWNRNYDYAVRLLGRSLFTIVGRIRYVFGFQRNESVNLSRDLPKPLRRLSRSHSVVGVMHSSVHPSNCIQIHKFSGPLGKHGTRSVPIAVTNRGTGWECLPHNGALPPSGKRRNLKTKWPGKGGPFSGCMVGGNESPFLQSCISVDGGYQRSNVTPRFQDGAQDAFPEADLEGNIFNMNMSLSMFETKFKLLNVPASTLGAAALALHYANVIIVIEKLLASPHLIGPDARDDLYSMLTTSIKSALRAKLKSYAKNLASSVFDPVLAAEWTKAMARILEWLSPLAHNMIRWQSTHNFERQQLVSSTNVLLLQTLYFANQAKTEASITELLVGLNYLWRFGRELSEKAILECVSSRNLDDSLDLKN